MGKKQNLVVLANPFVTSKGLAGGDLYYIELADYLAKTYQVSVILPQFAKVHWGQKKAKFLTLAPNIFDQSQTRIFLFATYLIRSIQTYNLLAKFPQKTIVCSSSEFLPDVLPIFWAKIRGKNYFWVARFYHLVSLSNRFPRPEDRGSLFLAQNALHLWHKCQDFFARNKNVNKAQNFISFLLQRLSIYMAIKKADLILVDNQKTSKFFKTKGVKNNRLLISGGSVDYKKLAKYRKEKKKVYDCVFAGRFDYTKGIFDLPEIWSKVVAAIPHAKLAIVGTATAQNQKKIRKLIEENHLEKNVDLLGFLPHTGKNTIFGVFARSKIFVSLTLEGGRDFALIEAMACSLPIVAYQQPFLTEGIINQGFLLAEKGNKQKIAQLIIYLLKNPKERNLISNKAASEVKKLDWPKTHATLSNRLLQFK